MAQFLGFVFLTTMLVEFFYFASGNPLYKFDSLSPYSPMADGPYVSDAAMDGPPYPRPLPPPCEGVFCAALSSAGREAGSYGAKVRERLGGKYLPASQEEEELGEIGEIVREQLQGAGLRLSKDQRDAMQPFYDDLADEDSKYHLKQTMLLNIKHIFSDERQGPLMAKRRWGNAVASCVEMFCSGMDGIDRITCMITKCHQKRQ